MTNEEVRKELIAFKDKSWDGMPEEVIDVAIKVIEQTTWIPCSERLPKPQKNGDKDYSDWLLITIRIGKNDDTYVGEAYYCFSENKWYAKRFVTGEVIAWMPLPPSYQGE